MHHQCSYKVVCKNIYLAVQLYRLVSKFINRFHKGRLQNIYKNRVVFVIISTRNVRIIATGCAENYCFWEAFLYSVIYHVIWMCINYLVYYFYFFLQCLMLFCISRKELDNGFKCCFFFLLFIFRPYVISCHVPYVFRYTGTSVSFRGVSAYAHISSQYHEILWVIFLITAERNI